MSARACCPDIVLTFLSPTLPAVSNYQDFSLIMKNVFSALKEPPRNWRIIFKALTLLEYLIRNGSERVVQETRDQIRRVKKLHNFEYKDGVYDRGSGA
mgnify:FL=1